MNKLKEITLCSIITLAVMVTLNGLWDWVSISSLEVAIGASIVLSVILKVAISLEKVMADICLNQKTLPKVKRGVSSYIILVGSKFLAMAVIGWIFGSQVAFTGLWGGIIAFFAVIFAVLGIEGAIGKLFAGQKEDIALAASVTNDK
ncbi:hypothetical protein MD588_13770 [Photobacterium sp. SDRW27]|uniref:hypothetical protein n=1 Tax=Photobacterium obscurum TaxID=2829490 RepID=UPI002244AB35|nr:hypothetical protein [Photobacterium obscurum]MCW8329875.1 hypothetical protein [Photobacterium obscurum]